jgi:hypothetical protein
MLHYIEEEESQARVRPMSAPRSLDPVIFVAVRPYSASTPQGLASVAGRLIEISTESEEIGKVLESSESSTDNLY